MRYFTLLVFFLLIFSLTTKAQVSSEEINQLKPCPVPQKLTKDELKRIRKIDKTTEHIYYSEPIKMFIGIEPKILSDTKTLGIIKIQTSNHQLTFINGGENDFLAAKLSFFGRITSIDKKIDGCFEEIVRFSLKEEDVKKDSPILFQRVFELQKGKYTLFFFLREIETGRISFEKFYFEIK